MYSVLVIDDERSIRNSLRDILEYEKFEVDDAENGNLALELLQNKSYNVILCDIKMPQMDGIELLEKILEKYETPCYYDFGAWNY